MRRIVVQNRSPRRRPSKGLFSYLKRLIVFIFHSLKRVLTPKPRAQRVKHAKHSEPKHQTTTRHVTNRPQKPKKKRDVKKIVSYIFVIGVAMALAGSVALLGIFLWFSSQLPDPDNIAGINAPQTTRIYDRTGEVILYEIHGDEKRTVVEIDQIAEHMIQATIAIEDKSFYEHKGFNFRGFARAMFINLKNMDLHGQGASTITQQYIKNSVLTTEKTYTRKIKELILSLAIERKFTKEQILKLYLNEIPYGSVVYGIESAAQTFFGKHASELSLSESAIIAALPQAPTRYSPYGSNTELLLGRSHTVINKMVEQGYINEDEAKEAKLDDVLSRIVPRNEAIKAPHFVFYVREILAEEFGETAVARGGYKVLTTLDVDMQERAEGIIEEQLEHIQELGGNTAAFLALDPRNGDVLSMIGSADYFDEEINGNYNAILGNLQPGSSIKPFVYAAAFERGFTPDTVIYDVETEFSDIEEESYSPKNYDLKEHGPMTIRESLAGSLNIPAVKMLYLTGVHYFSDFAKKFGYTTLGDTTKFGLSIVLGGAEVIPLEHISAFSIFAQDGIHREPRGILRVEDKDGKVLLETEDNVKGKRIIDEQIARQVNSILSDNAARTYAFGASSYLTLGERPIAAKTGTTNGYKDAWTIGYSPTLVSGVWVGKATGGEMEEGAAGGAIAAPIWNQFMRETLADTNFENFIEPEIIETGKPILDGVKNIQITVRIDTISGKLATEFTPEELVEEKGFGIPHSILYFVDTEDPRGETPETPESDTQFERWEEAISVWLKKPKEECVEDVCEEIEPEEEIEFSTDPAPTEFDDIHIPENVPNISLLTPRNNSTIREREFPVQISASAARGVKEVKYLLDDEVIQTFTRSPFYGNIIIPNRFSRGYHTLTVTAYDDVGNRASTSITINVNAAAGPLGVDWKAPYSHQRISTQSFPFNIRFTIPDIKSVKKLKVYAKEKGASGQVVNIGTIQNPPLPSMIMQWKTTPSEIGQYEIFLEAQLVSGDVRTESTVVNIVR